MLPVLGKGEVLQLQQADPPWGGMLAESADVVRVSGPRGRYEPQLAGDDYWRWGQALRSVGIGPQGTVINGFADRLSPAAAMMKPGVRAVGARVLPGAIASQDLQVLAIADLGVTAYTGLQSYLKALVERWAAGVNSEALVAEVRQRVHEGLRLPAELVPVPEIAGDAEPMVDTPDWS